MKGTRYDDLCEVGLREFGYAPCMSVWMCLLSVCPGPLCVVMECSLCVLETDCSFSLSVYLI